jgi:hypothetical protein
MTTATLAFEDEVYESIRECSAAAGQSVSEWLSAAARSAARRQSAANYVAWEQANYHEQGLDRLDEATAAASFDGAEW